MSLLKLRRKNGGLRLYQGVKIPMSDFQKRHYEQVVKILGTCTSLDEAIDSFVRVFSGDNSNFSASRFRDAIKKHRLAYVNNERDRP